MTDLYTHALFGFGDGPANIDDSIKILKNAYARGISSCVLAPCCVLHKRGDTAKFLSLRDKSVENIKKLNLKGLPSIIRGAQVLMDHDLSLHENIASLCIENSNFLLIELPDAEIVADFDEWIYCLNTKGIIPIIAHVEKYPFWKKLIEQLTDVKAYYQVGACVINNFFMRKIIKKLISARKNFFIASDEQDLSAHPPNLPCALEKVKKRLPKSTSFLLTNFNQTS